MSLSTTPRATARLQFHKNFTLEDATALVPYFAALGVSHLYASPLLTAQPGSVHGYDVINHSAINPELGGLPALRQLVAALRAKNMGLLLDIVPNHMGVGGAANGWWRDVLEFGPHSAFAGFFDIDWDPADPALRGKLLAPFLGAPYGEILQEGAIKLCFSADKSGFIFTYHEHEFPLSPRSTALLLRHLPGATPLARRFAAATNAAEAQDAKAALRETAGGNPGAIETLLASFATPTRLHMLLQRQHYRLAWWRSAAAEINWRRFFDINTLAGLRVESAKVFRATHEFTLQLYAEGLIDGVRIDHVDGLANPGAYLRKLRRAMAAAGRTRLPEAAQGAPYIVVEKILAPGEALDPAWRTDGTTGYDFMDQVSALLHQPAGEAPLLALWSKLGQRGAAFAPEEELARRQILQHNFAGELDQVGRILHRIARRDCLTSDYTLHAIHQGLTEILVHFPAYRLYADAAGAGAADVQVFTQATEAARHGLRPADQPILDLLRQWLLDARPCRLPPGAQRQDLRRARVKFAQLCAPTAAKAVEDTSFYRYGPLLSRNEVGASPARFSLTPAAFHALAAARLHTTPGALLATATHDHKRGEDTRARLAVLSEIPGEWEAALTRWMQLNAVLRSAEGPDPADELMLYQMLVAGWPLALEARNVAGIEAYGRRVAVWQRKALREAKLHSDWTAPNQAYEDAAERFLFGCLDAQRPVLYELIAFANRIAPAGALNGLAQTLLRLTAPGVPDLYQGTEFWDQSFVDPDNRRPVDFAARSAALAKPRLSLSGWRSGHAKQALIARVLNVRHALPALFAQGSYQGLSASGAMAENMFAFRRQHAGSTLIVIVTRLAGPFMVTAPLLPPSSWGRTTLNTGMPPGPWQNLLTGARLRGGASLQLGTLLAQLPVALLYHSSDGTLAP